MEFYSNFIGFYRSIKIPWIVLLANTPEEMHPTKFESISAESIWKAAIKTKGGLGPSDMDAVEWRIIISKKV